MAERCELRWDVPSFDVAGDDVFSETSAARIDKTDEEHAAVRRVTAEQHRALLAELRRLYVEVTGDEPGATDLTWAALGTEILHKAAPPEEVIATRARLARETAEEGRGAQEPNAPAIERYYRVMMAAGDRYEDALAGVLGSARARALRAEHNGWGHRPRSSGCPSDGP
jgi:hypothetical protein